MDLIIHLLLLTTISNAEVKDMRLRCLLGEYRGAECPLDGGWSSWGPWGPCQGQCGAAGRRVRRRLCDSPRPAQGGASCTGSDVDIETCAVPMCTMEQLEDLLAGDPVRQKAMAAVQQIHQKYPALLERCLLGNCYFDTVKNILQADAMRYWNSLMCVKHNVGCPVRGGWTAWSDWTRCSAVCGQGSEYHWRNCSDPPPSIPELMCRGVAFESRACTGSGCASKKDGVWSDWKQWSSCTAKCGKGVMKRERDCLRAQKRETQNVLKKHSRSRSSLLVARERKLAFVASPFHLRWARAVKSASSCSGAREEMKECQSSDCSVDGGWSQWDVWSPCSVPCGLGVQSRSRSCSSPVPQGKGAPCSGPTTEVQHCYPRPCSVKTHEVATFVGDGVLHYSSTGRPARMLLTYLRFRPQGPFGALIRRQQEECVGYTCDNVRIALEGGFLVLTVLSAGCSAVIIGGNKVEIDVWHEILVTITTSFVTLRVDNSFERHQSPFTCILRNPDFDQPMKVGEGFHGQIQQLVINYVPLRLRHTEIQKSSNQITGAAPFSTSNVVYEFADQEEGFRRIVNKELVHAPCEEDIKNWKIEVAVKLESSDGLILFMPGKKDGSYLMVSLENGAARLHVRDGDLYSEVIAPQQLSPGNWLNIYLDQTGWQEQESEGDEQKDVSISIGMRVNGAERLTLPSSGKGSHSQMSIVCGGEVFVGNTEDEWKTKLKKLDAKVAANELLLNPLPGVLGFLSVNEKLQDLGSVPAEFAAGQQFSSWTASVAELNSTPLVVMMVAGVLCLLIALCYTAVLAGEVYVERKNKFGAYQSFIRMIRGQSLSSEDQLENMLHLLNSEQSLLILGSEEAVKATKKKLVEKYGRLRAGGDLSTSYISSSNESFDSSSELPPLPMCTQRKTRK
ncbi:uncharacterized protein LOC126335308 isoform X3 [Schistocerca gregaria]|uniref:uncharacterized protein LOC126335308 isoform X3 n=1 Tax=Schistocerca gregaria TaxID=7010 RepID=UPI00211E1AA5|nr:uncharacterized protein LOC126335308 isoform X3 [Schistocerca gregaria]